jgi:hypothetical protein
LSIIKHVTLQKIVAHDFQYDPPNNKLILSVAHAQDLIWRLNAHIPV